MRPLQSSLVSFFIFGSMLVGCFSLFASQPELKVFELSTPTLEVKLTPDVGGRVFYFGLKNHENFLRVGPELYTQPHPSVTADSPNIGYLGLEIWLGPQSEWWIHQSLNPTRKAAKATWPPDPYLVQTSQKVIEHTPNKISFKSKASPISGVSLEKHFTMNSNENNSLNIEVKAKNERSEALAWDIWFNARVNSNAHVYVPVAQQTAMDINYYDTQKHASFGVSYQREYLLLKTSPPPEGKVGRDGKIRIQPSEGWMAAFYHHQVFVIQFKLQPKEMIHPEQGQIELFQWDEPSSTEGSLTEMEVHAPYKKLMPGETMSANEKWTLVEYLGEDSIEAELDFLTQLRKKLNLN